MVRKQLALIIVLSVVMGTLQAEEPHQAAPEATQEQVTASVSDVPDSAHDAVVTMDSDKVVDSDAQSALPTSDSDIGDSDIQALLQSMMESGASSQDLEPEPLPWWKEWLMRAGDVVIPRYYAVKHYISDRYYAFRKKVNELMARIVVRRAIEQQQEKQANATESSNEAAEQAAA